MSYTSDVRSLVYGDPFRMKNLLAGSPTLMLQEVSVICGKQISLYRAKLGHLPETDIHVLDLNGKCWKWYAAIPTISDWYRFMSDAESQGLHYEFFRIGENYDPIDLETHTSENSSGFLEYGPVGITNSIKKIGEDIPLLKLTFPAP